MDSEERDAVDAALRRVVEDTVFPWVRVGASLARYEQQQKAEQERWDGFLPGHSGPAATRAIEAPGPGGLRIGYAPDVTGALAPGEIVRTWIPPTDDLPGVYEEALLIGRHSADRFAALRMSTRSHQGAHRWFPIGAGPRNDYGRYSWVDLDHLCSVHAAGVHRSGFAIDRAHFLRIADELRLRRRWPMDD